MHRRSGSQLLISLICSTLREGVDMLHPIEQYPPTQRFLDKYFARGLTLLAISLICIIPSRAFPLPDPSPSKLASKTASYKVQQLEAILANQSSAFLKADNSLLELGNGFDRMLVGGEVHSYRIIVGAQHYLRLDVYTSAIDVILTLFGPDGKKLKEADTPISAAAGKSIVWISETQGEYRFEVRARENNAAAAMYNVTFKRLLPVTEQNKNFIIADSATVEGWRLREIATEKALREAIEKFTEAIPHWQAAGELFEEATTLMYLGECYDKLTEYQKALDTYSKALLVWQQLKKDADLGWVYNNIGKVYNVWGEKQKALDYFIRSLNAYNTGSNPRGMGIALTAIGGVYISLGDIQKALKYLNRALPYWQKVNDIHGEARALYYIGESYTLSGKYQKALEYYPQALQFWRSTADFVLQVRVLNSIGKTYTLLKEQQKAINYLNEGLQVAQASGDTRGQAYTLTNLGKVCFSFGDAQKALDHYNQSLILWQVVGDREGEADMFCSMARAEHVQGNFDRACSSIDKALALIESVRISIASQDLRASYLATVQSYYEFYIDLLMEMDSRTPFAGYAARALQMSERARARSLIETLSEARADIRQGVEPQLIDRQRSLQQQLNAKARYQQSLPNTKQGQEKSKTVEKEIEELLAAYQTVQVEIRKTSPHYATLTQPNILSIEEIKQQLLDSDTILLEYALGDKRSYLWMVTPTSFTSYQLSRRTDIEAEARHMYSALSSQAHRSKFITSDKKLTRLAQTDSKYRKAALALSQMLLSPVAEQLGNKRLLIVADGALQYVPFQALPVPKKKLGNEESLTFSSPLIAANEIVNLSSASTLAILRQQLTGRTPAPKSVVVLADPVFDAQDSRIKLKGGSTNQVETLRKYVMGSRNEVERSAREVGVINKGYIPRLPSTRREANAIVSLVRGEEYKLALDFAASHATATDAQMSQYRIVHFATHALLNSKHPELSGIVLSLFNKDGQQQDGFLRAHEIYNLRLPAELVVLSACQTALGKDIRGEGLVGLTRGFMYAGAARIVSSLWEVDSKATAELMTRFYKGILKDGLSPAAALRAAQLSMLQEKQWASPYYWAGFIIQGEYK